MTEEHQLLLEKHYERLLDTLFDACEILPEQDDDDEGILFDEC